MITIDIHIEISARDWHSNVEKFDRDLLADIRDALDAVIGFRYSDRIKVKIENEGHQRDPYTGKFIRF